MGLVGQLTWPSAHTFGLAWFRVLEDVYRFEVGHEGKRRSRGAAHAGLQIGVSCTCPRAPRYANYSGTFD